MKKKLFLCLLFISLILNAQINLGVGSTDVGRAPIITTMEYSYVQQIFTKQEINANAAGNITGLKFYLDPASDITNSSDWTVYLGLTAKTEFSSDTDWIPLSQLQEVYQGNITNNNGVVEIIFPVSFSYNNTSNLVVAVDENTPDYDSNGGSQAFYVYPSTPHGALTVGYYNINMDPASPPTFNSFLSGNKSVITINGLTEDSAPACPTITYPGNNSTLIPVSPNIVWNAVPGATSYKVSIGTNPGGTDIVNQMSVSSNTFTPSPLGSSTTYYVKVIAIGAAGESSGCLNTAFTTVPSPPANDECSDATLLTVNPDLNCGSVTSSTTLGATDSGVNPSPCSGNPDDDVWFKFIATEASHLLSFNNLTSVGTIFNGDFRYQIFSGDCGNLTDIICSTQNFQTLSGLTVGNTYYIRAFEPNGVGFNESFDICIGTFPPAPANDACSGAIIVAQLPYTNTQLDAAGSTNNNGFITGCSALYWDGATNDGLWYTFQGNGSTVYINTTTPGINNNTGIEFNAKLSVYAGNCSAYSCVGMADNQDSGHLGWEHLSIPTTAGTTYYVNVGSYSGGMDDPEDVFTITISNEALGTSEASSKNDLKVYPNPFADVLNISDASKVKNVLINDISGRLVKKIANPSSALQLGELKSGMYIVTLEMKDGSKQKIKTIKK